MNSSQLRKGSFSSLAMRLVIEARTSANRDSIFSVAASSIFCSRSAAAACVELLDEAPDVGVAPVFGGRFMTLIVEV